MTTIDNNQPTLRLTVNRVAVLNTLRASLREVKGFTAGPARSVQQYNYWRAYSDGVVATAKRLAGFVGPDDEQVAALVEDLIEARHQVHTHSRIMAAH